MIIKIVTKERKKAVKVKVTDQKRKEKNLYERKNNRNRKLLLKRKGELSEIHNNLGSHLLGGIEEVLSTHFPDLEKELDKVQVLEWEKHLLEDRKDKKQGLLA